MENWNPRQYLKFEKERTQPSHDLVSRLSGLPRTVLDVGCGPGNSTALLKERFPDAEILGIDSSEEMIAKAEKNCPDLQFKCQGIDSGFRIDGKYDLIFSNACLQWVPGHPELIPNMLNALNPGGTLAVQVPETHDTPMYRTLARLSGEPEWTEYFAGIHNFHTLALPDYYDLLAAHTAEFSIWETVYIHTMNGIEGILEWYRGSGLRPYLAVLTEEKQEKLLGVLREELAKLYEIRANGKVMMRFPRLFFTAKR